MFTFVHFSERMAGLVLSFWAGGPVLRGGDVVGREYFNRQAATLLKFAKVVADPEVAAGLVEKAADLKEQAERPQHDAGDQTPDSAGGQSCSD
jgi:hypothetical protein